MRRRKEWKASSISSHRRGQQKCCSYQMITHGWWLVNIRENSIMKDYLQF